MTDLRSNDFSSGKGAGDENFPVGSFLISSRYRPFVHDFYGFVRCADDIADHGDLLPDEKLSLLESQERALCGACGYGVNDFPAAHRLRMRLLDYPHLLPHARDMLVAFRRDATKNRYKDWEDLLDYCSFSASPVGRFLLDLHGESDDCYVYSDALCTALQILNHLQDCGADYESLDRVYIPEDFFVRYKCEISMLGLDSVSPPLRLVLDSCLDGIGDLLSRARHLPASLSSGRLGLESAVILSMAERLTLLLAKGDPLASRVALGKIDFLRRSFIGMVCFFMGRY